MIAPSLRSSIALRLRQGVVWEPLAENGPRLSAPPWPDIPIAPEDRTAHHLLSRLAAEGGTEDALAEAADAEGGPIAAATSIHHLRRLASAQLLAFEVRRGAAALLSLEPVSPWFEARFTTLDPDARVVLSRFAFQRRKAATPWLESPRAHAAVRLMAPCAAAFCFALAEPRSRDELCAATGLLAPEVDALLAVLSCARMVVSVSAAGESEEETSVQLAGWSFHDLLFHAKSRAGRSGEPSGKTYPLRDRFPPLPALRPKAPDEETISLPRANIDALVKGDVPFTSVLESRHSDRHHDEAPLSLEELGAFLFRAARARETRALDGVVPYETVPRPYPSGGATYDLEIYLAVDRCAGLDPGLYHYDPGAHALSLRAGRTPDVTLLLQGAARALLLPAPPPVLVLLASRFQRVSWSYQGIPYAITLKNAGVLIQTLYLVAEAMGLAACAVGQGDSDTFARAAGTDYFAETTVGELALGRRSAR